METEIFYKSFGGENQEVRYWDIEITKVSNIQYVLSFNQFYFRKQEVNVIVTLTIEHLKRLAAALSDLSYTFYSRENKAGDYTDFVAVENSDEMLFVTEIHYRDIGIDDATSIRVPRALFQDELLEAIKKELNSD